MLQLELNLRCLFLPMLLLLKLVDYLALLSTVGPIFVSKCLLCLVIIMSGSDAMVDNVSEVSSE